MRYICSIRIAIRRIKRFATFYCFEYINIIRIDAFLSKLSASI